jgi:NAD(P)-dependent dehydrogenase (short-subunit alcohol dehydrogenase family)
MTDCPTAIVTGASSGIGHAIATRLAADGYRVFGTSRTDPSLSVLDVTDPDSCTALVARVLDEAGRIDVLVNNAGCSMLGAQEELTDDEIRAMFEANVFGAMRLSRAVLPIMRMAGRGRLVHVSSVSGLIPSPFMGAYGATKHALEGWSASLDHEVRPFGIRSVTVRPGFMRTRIAENSVSALCPLPAYRPGRTRFETALLAALVTGEDPVRVALTVSRALAAKHPRSAYPAGTAAGRLLALRALLPAALFDRGLRKTFDLAG